MDSGKVKVPLFDLRITLTSGQVFGWKKIDDWYYGEIAGKPVRVRQEEDFIHYEGISEKRIVDYFSLDEDVERIYLMISERDQIIRRAVKEFSGLRLLRQDPWICTISFVCSVFSNIPRIEKKLGNLRIRYGKTVHIGGHSINLFPTPEQLGSASIPDLRACGLGFRDKYVKRLGERMKDFDVSQLRKTSYEEAKSSLMESSGIGEKVADCICLFSLDKYEAFPIDVWIARIMTHLYGSAIKSMFPGTKFSYRDIQAFARAKWGKDAGYAQEFLYMYARKHKFGTGRKE